MSNLENAPVASTIKVESPAWNPSALFFDSDLMDVDSPCALKIDPGYTIEAQYSHIQSPDFMTLASPFDAQNSSMPFVSDPSASSTAPNMRPSIFLSRLISPSAHNIEPTAPNDTNTRLIDPATFPPSNATTFSLANVSAFPSDVTMLTPADPLISPHTFKEAMTPFGKNFELSDDWLASGSYISPVIHAHHAKQPLLRLFPSPATSFMDRLQASSSPSGPVPSRHHDAKNNARSPLPLLSPCKLTVSFRTSAKKENLSHAQLRAQFPDAFSSPLTSSAPSSASRRPPTKPRGHITPQRPANILVSPLTPLTPSSNKTSSLAPKNSLPPALDAKPKKRRLSLAISDSESPTTRVKRARYSLRAGNSTASAPAPVLGLGKSTQSEPVFSTRTLPSASFVVSPDFPLFYRRFPASSYFQIDGSGSPCTLLGVLHPGGEYQAPRDPFDLYSARFVKGKGTEKMGLCPICIEPQHRGGEGKKVWLSMKFSAFNYHMQFYHGISASTGRPLSPPTDFRVVTRPAPKKTERKEVQEGKCHKCLRWVVIETVKDVEVKVPELFWWKHAAACHSGSVLVDEGDVFEEDEVFEVLKRTSTC